MCIIIDTNTLPAVFRVDSANQADFFPVLDWIENGRGKVVYGGTKYENEVKKKYLGIFVELNKKGKGIYIDNAIVDAKEVQISPIIIHPDFDDQHLVALLMVSGCKLICSLDQRAYPYFKHATFFSPARNRPRIYNQIGNKDLLSNGNIVNICK
jgi:hypothetical protein